MSIISKLFSGSAGDLIEKVGNTVDKFVTTGKEREELKQEMLKVVQDHEVKMAQLAQAEFDAQLKDTADARNSNTQIQLSDKASWLSKNVGYIIDLFLAALWGTVTVILFLKIFKITADNVDMISLMALHGTVTAVFMTVVNFHRGSSKSSDDKQRHIEKMMKK